MKEWYKVEYEEDGEIVARIELGNSDTVDYYHNRSGLKLLEVSRYEEYEKAV